MVIAPSAHTLEREQTGEREKKNEKSTFFWSEGRTQPRRSRCRVRPSWCGWEERGEKDDRPERSVITTLPVKQGRETGDRKKDSRTTESREGEEGRCEGHRHNPTFDAPKVETLKRAKHDFRRNPAGSRSSLLLSPRCLDHLARDGMHGHRPKNSQSCFLAHALLTDAPPRQ